MTTTKIRSHDSRMIALTNILEELHKGATDASIKSWGSGFVTVGDEQVSRAKRGADLAAFQLAPAALHIMERLVEEYRWLHGPIRELTAAHQAVLRFPDVGATRELGLPESQAFHRLRDTALKARCIVFEQGPNGLAGLPDPLQEAGRLCALVRDLGTSEGLTTEEIEERVGREALPMVRRLIPMLEDIAALQAEHSCHHAERLLDLLRVSEFALGWVSKDEIRELAVALARALEWPVEAYEAGWDAWWAWGPRGRLEEEDAA